MKYITKLRLAMIHKYCQVEDKSTEFMYQRMQDVVGVNIDAVNNYMVNADHEQLFKEVDLLFDTAEKTVII